MVRVGIGSSEFEEFDRTYRRRVRALAVQLVGDADADDVTQEVMLRAAWHLERHGFDGEPWLWLFVVARRCAVDHRRTLGRVTPTGDDLLDACAPSPDEPEDVAIRADVRRRLSRALQRLPVADRILLVRHEVDGATAVSLAPAFGLTANAMRQRLYRARRNLAHHYQQLGGHSLGIAAQLRPDWTRRLAAVVRDRDGAFRPLQGQGRIVAAAIAVIGTTQVGGPSPTRDVPASPPPAETQATPFPSRTVMLDPSRLVPPALSRPVPSLPALARPGESARGLRWTKHQGPAPSARYQAAVAYDERRHEMVLFGGADGSSTFAETWVWDGTSWTRRRPATSPSGRSGSAMTYDAVRGEIVLFGGQVPGIGHVNETWVWDGETWTQRVPATSPPARSDASLAFDPARGRAVLFGGIGAVTRADTWTWDGETWTMSAATSPRSRYGARLAFDPAGQRLILHGGRENVSWPRTDTWAWDGTAWQELLPDSVPDTPRASADVAVLYDSARRTVVAFTGAEAWDWAGTDWRPVRSDAAPEGRPFPAVVFDTARSEIVLFGGGRDGVAYGDMWRATFDGDDPEPGVDRTAPLSTFTSEDAAVLGAGEAVAGRTVDAGTGTRTVHVVFAPVEDELTARSRRITVVAILTCLRSRTECTWLVEVPDTPGTYVVTARATDAAGNVEPVGARTVVTRAV